MNSRRLHTTCALAMLLGGAAFGADERPGPRAVMLNTNPQPVRNLEGDGDAELVYPPRTSSAPFTQLAGTTVTFTWEHGTNAKGYYLAVSTSPGGALGFSNGYTTGTSRTVTGIPCNGQPIYVTLWTDIAGGTFTTTPPVVRYDGPVNCGPDPRATITSPAPGLSFVGNSATFAWDAVAGAVNYTLEVGNTLGGNPIYRWLGGRHVENSFRAALRWKRRLCAALDTIVRRQSDPDRLLLQGVDEL